MENSDSEGEERGEQLSPEQTDKLVQLQVTVGHRHTGAAGSVSVEKSPVFCPFFLCDFVRFL